MFFPLILIQCKNFFYKNLHIFRNRPNQNHMKPFFKKVELANKKSQGKDFFNLLCYQYKLR